MHDFQSVSIGGTNRHCRTMTFVGLVLVLLLGMLAFAPTAQAETPYPDADWPLWHAEWMIEIVKDPDAVPTPHEPSDLSWLHFHRNHPELMDASVNTIRPRIVRGYQTLDPATPDIQLQYVVRGQAVSGWLDAPFVFELSIDNPAFEAMADGVHDLTAVVRGPDRLDFHPLPAFIHLTRERSEGNPYGYDTSVPIMNRVQEAPGVHNDWSFGPGITYVDPSERNFVGYPVNPEGTPWSTPPLETDLYQELMAPHSELFGAVQMWWDHPGETGNSFVRGLTPKHGEDHRTLRVGFGHERFPMKDGPSGVGWMSPYVSGAVDSQGRFAFAEAGGRVGYLLPDGEIVTLAGWRVQPGLDPLWWEKPTDVVRQNMELVGDWQDGRGEFFTPLDVAIDPLDENILYVAAYEDHVIWKVEVPDDLRNGVATVSILAGAPDHTAGFADGSGAGARFNGVASLVFDPIADALYVADQDNDAIRRVERNGTVTTVAGAPGMQQQLVAAGVTWTDQLASRAATQFTVTASEANAGVQPDIYLPQSIRVDSQGNIILLEIGYGSIRRIDPTTGETELLDEVRQKHREYDRGWAWLDVDRWGNSGPVDGVYWTKFVSTLDGEVFNEVFRWLPPDGGPSVNLFPNGTGLYPDGWGEIERTNAPHYGWLVAVDPRGGVLLGGGGEHGLTRLRLQRDDDPVETQNYWLGRWVWRTNTPIDAAVATQSIALKYGWGGHNYLGLTDAWSLSGATDAELLDAFEVSDAVRNDPQATAYLLEFIRPNTFRATGTPVPTDPLDCLDQFVDELAQLACFATSVQNNLDATPSAELDDLRELRTRVIDLKRQLLNVRRSLRAGLPIRAGLIGSVRYRQATESIVTLRHQLLEIRAALAQVRADVQAARP